MPDTLTDQEAVVIALRNATREARETLKDIRHATKEAREEIPKLMRESIEQYLAEQVKIGVASFQEAIDQAIARTSETVLKRFDDLTDILLRGKKGNKSQFDIEQIIRDQAGG